MNKRPLVAIVTMVVLGEVLGQGSKLGLLIIINCIIIFLLVLDYLIKRLMKENGYKKSHSFFRIKKLYLFSEKYHINNRTLLYLMLIGSTMFFIHGNEMKKTKLKYEFNGYGEGVYAYGKVDNIIEKGDEKWIYLKVYKLYGSTINDNNSTKCVVKKINNNFKIGQKIVVYGQIKEFPIPTNPGEFNSKEYYESLGFLYYIDADSVNIISPKYSYIREWLHTLRDNLAKKIEDIYSKKNSPIVKAMIIGDTSSLNKETKENFQLTGISHIIAISGVKTLCLVSPLSLENGLKWGFRRLHNAKKFIQNLCFKGQFLDRCPPRFCGG